MEFQESHDPKKNSDLGSSGTKTTTTTTTTAVLRPRLILHESIKKIFAGFPRVECISTNSTGIVETGVVSSPEKMNGILTSDKATTMGRKENRRILSDREMKILSAIFYAVSSSLITVINKIILTSFGFPSYQFLALGQICATILILRIAQGFNLVTFPPLEKNTFGKIFPLPLLFLGNAVFGLGATKEVSLPMFTALRRISILMTMFGEFYILGTKASMAVQIAVYTMVGGTLLASTNDLSFNLRGYFLITLSNLFTAANGIYIKKMLNAKQYGKYGLVYYNAVFMLVPLLFLAHLSGDFQKVVAFDGWLNFYFLASFLLSCVMGFALNASNILCTHYNSALTTAIVGCLKNVTVTYFGMFIGGDYVYDTINFIGINISTLGSLLYTYVTFN